MYARFEGVFRQHPYSDIGVLGPSVRSFGYMLETRALGADN
jgi:hypothetical protein